MFDEQEEVNPIDEQDVAVLLRQGKQLNVPKRGTLGWYPSQASITIGILHQYQSTHPQKVKTGSSSVVCPCGCGETFTPTRPNMLYATPSCGTRMSNRAISRAIKDKLKANLQPNEIAEIPNGWSRLFDIAQELRVSPDKPIYWCKKLGITTYRLVTARARPHVVPPEDVKLLLKHYHSLGIKENVS